MNALATLDTAAKQYAGATSPDARTQAWRMMTTAHDSLLKHLRNAKKETPEWEKYPQGRDVFLQQDPWTHTR